MPETTYEISKELLRELMAVCDLLVAHVPPGSEEQYRANGAWAELQIILEGKMVMDFLSAERMVRCKNCGIRMSASEAECPLCATRACGQSSGTTAEARAGE
jgi:lipopolysaccharide biosynthesis regulator YciM